MKRKHLIPIILLVIVILTSCSRYSSAENNDTISKVQEACRDLIHNLQSVAEGTEESATTIETSITITPSPSPTPSATPSPTPSPSPEPASTQESNPTITDDGYRLIYYEDGEENMLEQFEEALALREEKVYLIGADDMRETGYFNESVTGVSNSDFRLMDYSTFWLLDFTVNNQVIYVNGRIKTAREYLFIYLDLTDDQIQEMKTQIDDEVDSIVACIPEDSDDWRKCQIVHDELITRITYESSMEGPHVHDLYGALVEHNCVCEGYALAYKYILDYLGIDNGLISNNYDPVSMHVWNYVYVNSDEMYIDVTVDDINTNNSDGKPIICYCYFGLTAEELRSLESHYSSFTPTPVITGEEAVFNYYRHEGYYLSECNIDQIISIINEQINSGLPSCNIRFDNATAYQQALNGLRSGTIPGNWFYVDGLNAICIYY